MEDLDKIKERIAKLLAMAEDTSSPEEAAIAASRARKLMDKYQLDAWQVSKKIEDAMVSKSVTRTYAMMPEYIQWLATSVAKYNDCQAILEFGVMTYKMQAKRNQNDGRDPKSFGRHLVFRGYESDVHMAADMLNRLLEAASKCCKKYLDGRGFSKYPVKEGTAFKAQFCSTVGSRLNDLTKERDEITFTPKSESGASLDDLMKIRDDMISAGASDDNQSLLAICSDIAALSSKSTSLVLVKTAKVEEHFGEVKYKKGNYEADMDDHSVREATRAGYQAGKIQELVKEIQ